MKPHRILIVEDEVLIADTLKRYLEKQGHTIVGMAINFEEAQNYLEKHQPDLALLDIRLNGEKTGIDVAHYIRSKMSNTKFIYLSSQLDKNSLDHAKETFPKGYLSKPIQKETLFTTIEIAMHNHYGLNKDEESILLNDGHKNFRVSMNKILFLEAEHVYVKVHTSQKREPIIIRSSLSEMLKKLPQKEFIQTHRSFIVNTEHIDYWDKNFIYVAKKAIMVSRARKKDVLTYLEKIISTIQNINPTVQNIIS